MLNFLPEIGTILGPRGAGQGTTKEKPLDQLFKIGGEYEGTVLGKNEGLELISVGDRIIRAKSENLLPDGSYVRFKVLDNTHPIKIKLLNIIVNKDNLRNLNENLRTFFELKTNSWQLNNNLQTILNLKIPDIIVNTTQTQEISNFIDTINLIKLLSLPNNESIENDSKIIQVLSKIFQEDQNSNSLPIKNFLIKNIEEIYNLLLNKKITNESFFNDKKLDQYRELILNVLNEAKLQYSDKNFTYDKLNIIRNYFYYENIINNIKNQINELYNSLEFTSDKIQSEFIDDKTQNTNTFNKINKTYVDDISTTRNLEANKNVELNKIINASENNNNDDIKNEISLNNNKQNSFINKENTDLNIGLRNLQSNERNENKLQIIDSTTIKDNKNINSNENQLQKTVQNTNEANENVLIKSNQTIQKHFDKEVNINDNKAISQSQSSDNKNLSQENTKNNNIYHKDQITNDNNKYNQVNNKDLDGKNSIQNTIEYKIDKPTDKQEPKNYHLTQNNYKQQEINLDNKQIKDNNRSIDIDQNIISKHKDKTSNDIQYKNTSDFINNKDLASNHQFKTKNDIIQDEISPFNKNTNAKNEFSTKTEVIPNKEDLNNNIQSKEDLKNKLLLSDQKNTQFTSEQLDKPEIQNKPDMNNLERKIFTQLNTFDAQKEELNTLLKQANLTEHDIIKIIDGFKSLIKHAEAISNYQNQLRQEFDINIFTFPIWFKDGSSGSISWWQERNEKTKSEYKSDTYNLFFDLNLQELGQVKILIMKKDQNIDISIAANKTSISIIRKNLAPLRERLNALGLKITNINTFSLFEDAPPNMKGTPFEPLAKKGYLSLIT